MSSEISQKHDFNTILMPMKNPFPFTSTTTYLILYNTDLICNLWCLGFLIYFGVMAVMASFQSDSRPAQANRHLNMTLVFIDK